MPEATTVNMLVYRDGRSRMPAQDLVRQLGPALANVQPGCTDDALLTALLRAGELECALCDAGSPDAEAAAAFTDQVASMACGTQESTGGALAICQQLLSSIHCDADLTVSRPEGFAYYALHPLDFADLVSDAVLHAPYAHVVGIRSIGTTLSAVVAAKLRLEGIPASRTTVRPEGHPYDRQTAFTPAQRDSIAQAFSHGALFLVCDEGPGRSGSSLLSAAQALDAEGVSCDRIVLLCSHQPDADALCAPGAGERWRRYRSVAAGLTQRLPQQAGQYIGGGQWREFFLAPGEPWPAAWPQMERLKFLSRDRQKVFKFQGHGPYGEAVRQREQRLPASGFGPRYLGHEAGFGIYELVGGHPPDIAKPSESLLCHLAKYCAWRADTFPAKVSHDNIRQLEHMAAHNIEQAFGSATEVQLELERPAICDGRMQPSKWRELGNNRWIKLDASTHGDDHFFPGPADIAWDLAGICVEWQLSPDYRDFLLSEYRRVSGDNPSERLQAYEVAYAAFRLGWSRMAAGSVCGSEDQGRLLQDAERYRAALDRTRLTNSLLR